MQVVHPEHVLPLLPVQPAQVLEGGAHTLFVELHGWPAEQHVRLAPLPQGVVPAGQPHVPLALSTQAMPALQQLGPHGVVPDAQQQWVVGSEQVPVQHTG